MKKAIIIPARYASQRFPGKVLAPILGKPMIQHVYERCKLSSADMVIIATESPAVFKVCQQFEADVRMTSANHKSGTDRCIEIARELTDVDYIMNVQGDEPLIDPKSINALFDYIISSNTQIATLKNTLIHHADIQNPNVVKCVCAHSGKALFFSRSTIPFHRDLGKNRPQYYAHVGIYVFQYKTLIHIGQLLQSELEIAENLEQLRWLENGLDIWVLKTDYKSIGVDTLADLEEVEVRMQRVNSS